MEHKNNVDTLGVSVVLGTIEASSAKEKAGKK